MIDTAAVCAMLEREGLPAWAAMVGQQIDALLTLSPHGDWARWQDAIGRLPTLGRGSVQTIDGAWALQPEHALDAPGRERLADALQALHPWRKGPYDIAGVHIDTEWRSDWKWDRVAPHMQSLQGRLVLDVGCGNGYYAWRMAEAGARQVIGIDPTALFMAQFFAVRQLMQSMQSALVERVTLLPIGIEAVPPRLRTFDTVLSMGVLYHRRSPIDHLYELHAALRHGGELVLETLVIDGAAGEVLVPEGRYAKMRNVWFIPTTATLEGWLKRCGFRDIRTVDVTTTTLEEQRSSAWMRFESLADFLDPADNRFTIEGHPAPKRATLIART